MALQCLPDHAAIDAEEHYSTQPGRHFADKVIERLPLRLTAGNPDDGVEGAQRNLSCVRVGRLGIVDVDNAIDLTHPRDAMGCWRETLQAGAHRTGRHAE